MAEEGEKLSETKTPPAGAGWPMVTVPVVGVPPVTFAGIKLTLTTGGGNTFKVCETIPDLVAAVTVTGVRLPTAFAVTIKV